MKPSHLLDRVKHVLASKPEPRDWDSKLVFQVLGKELFDSELLNINCMTLQEIDSRIETGKFSSYESICRFARMIKSKYPELKGKRIRKSEEKVKEELLVYKKDLFEL